MSRPIILSLEQWAKLHTKLSQDNHSSVMLIRTKMRHVLGFTVRRHTNWIDQKVDLKDVRYNTKYREESIHLDFYDEPKRTMFLLRYSDYI